MEISRTKYNNFDSAFPSHKNEIFMANETFLMHLYFESQIHCNIDASG